MKTLATLLLTLFLFSCSKENILDPTFENKPQPRETTRVSLHAHGWKANYRLKYIRLGNWCDTVIRDTNYTIQYLCYTNELQHPVSINTIERYDKDTIALSLTVNTTIATFAIINKCDAEISLQPNQAL